MLLIRCASILIIDCYLPAKCTNKPSMKKVRLMSGFWQRCTKFGWTLWFLFFSFLNLYMKRTVQTFCMTKITEAGSNCLASELFSRFRILVHSISVIVGDLISSGLQFHDVVPRCIIVPDDIAIQSSHLKPRNFIY